MLRTLGILFVLCCGSIAGAQSYVVEVRSGVGEVVSPPYTRVQVNISRTDTRPFVGRVVVDLGASGMPTGGGRRGRGRPRSPMIQSGEVQISKDISLAEGATNELVSLDVPVAGMLSMEVRLERQVTSDYYETVAAVQDAPPVTYDARRQLVGFVSPARLKAAQPWLFFQVAEIPVNELPDSWKSLAGFDALVINDDRLTLAQSKALADYMAAGGTVILSPSSAGSFNPETLAGSLLRIPATTPQKWLSLKEFDGILDGKLTSSGFNLPPSGAEEAGRPGETAVAPPPETTTEPEQPSGDSQVRIWPESGRAKPVPDTAGLISIARVGAGNLVLLHTDISAEPFASGSHRAPTTACIKLLELAREKVGGRAGQSPTLLLADPDVRDTVDIAGRRIPGRDALVIVLLLYVAIAGVGMFVVARRLRRPELYPATLLLAALVSVGLVFGLGELYKRSGDRVKAVRILVSDETTDRNAVFGLGCAYAVSGDSYEFETSPRVSLLPAKMESGLMRGMPADGLPYTASITGSQAATSISGLDRWQNVFFLQREPANLEGFAVEVVSMEGAVRVVNKSPHELKACVFLVGGNAPGGTQACEWHYVARIGPAGSPDASITFSESTRLSDGVEDLARRVADETGDLEREVLGAMFEINPDDRMTMASSLQQLESQLYTAGLRPEPGEFLLMSVLPQSALNPGSLGAQAVEDDDVGQVNLWMVRGGVEGR
ncbi:MAG: hypothetical protein H6841_02500 [Planctomycetes bacterium]|nr:hypothetical protein [Planctomycetota bacterium]MCB9936544.1 hypothetical protein [Planctomycetota bacterium]